MSYHGSIGTFEEIFTSRRPTQKLWHVRRKNGVTLQPWHLGCSSGCCIVGRVIKSRQQFFTVRILVFLYPMKKNQAKQLINNAQLLFFTFWNILKNSNSAATGSSESRWHGFLQLRVKRTSFQSIAGIQMKAVSLWADHCLTITMSTQDFLRFLIR